MIPLGTPPADSGISVVVPTLNDRDGLDQLIHALAQQTRAPDEVVVVDGGSTDGTKELLDAWRAETDVPVKIITGQSLSIGSARNAGVEAAAHDWIACTDAGCRPIPGWLSAIDAARHDADFVAGVVLIEGWTPFERALALTHYPSPAELQDPGLFVRISHRLFGRGYDPDRVGGAYMAFSKAVWSAVGGFPDELAASEDHAFSSEVVARGFRFARAREAAVRCGTTSATRRTQTVARMPWRIRPLTLTSLWSPPGSWRGKRRDVPPLLARRMGCATRVGTRSGELHRASRAPSARRRLPAAALVADPAGGRAQGRVADRGRGGGRSRRHQGAASRSLVEV